jgi:hypothetical protein
MILVSLCVLCVICDSVVSNSYEDPPQRHREHKGRTESPNEKVPGKTIQLLTVPVLFCRFPTWQK